MASGLSRAWVVVALCYVLIVQAVLGTALRTLHGPLVPGQSTVLCVSGAAPISDDSAPDRGSHHEMACCLSATRTACNPPALADAGTDWIAPAVVRFATAVEWDPPSVRVGGSVDIDARPARAPPAIVS
jgi:hypothetical protein